MARKLTDVTNDRLVTVRSKRSKKGRRVRDPVAVGAFKRRTLKDGLRKEGSSLQNDEKMRRASAEYGSTLAKIGSQYNLGGSSQYAGELPLSRSNLAMRERLGFGDGKSAKTKHLEQVARRFNELKILQRRSVPPVSQRGPQTLLGNVNVVPGFPLFPPPPNPPPPPPNYRQAMNRRIMSLYNTGEEEEEEEKEEYSQQEEKEGDDDEFADIRGQDEFSQFMADNERISDASSLFRPLLGTVTTESSVPIQPHQAPTMGGRDRIKRPGLSKADSEISKAGAELSPQHYPTRTRAGKRTNRSPSGPPELTRETSDPETSERAKGKGKRRKLKMSNAK